MQQCANQRFSLESQCINHQQTHSLKTQPKKKNHHPQIPQSTDLTKDQSTPPFLTTRFKANQRLLNFSFGLRGVEREGLGMTTSTSEVKLQTLSCHESPALSVSQQASNICHHSRLQLPPTLPHAQGGHWYRKVT